MTPTRTSLKVNVARLGRDGDVARRDQADAAAEGVAVDRRDHRLRPVPDRLQDRRRTDCAAPPPGATAPPPPFRSAPAQNAGPVPVRTTTRTAASSRSPRAGAAPQRRRSCAADSALRVCGRVERDPRGAAADLVLDGLAVSTSAALRFTLDGRDDHQHGVGIDQLPDLDAHLAHHAVGACATSSCSIFIASRMTSTCALLRRGRPAPTCTARTMPGIGARQPPATSSRRRGGKRGTSTSSAVPSGAVHGRPRRRAVATRNRRRTPSTSSVDRVRRSPMRPRAVDARRRRPRPSKRPPAAAT